MAPSAAFKSREAEKERVYRLRMATEQYAQATHLVEGFADTLDALPPALTRSLSDLKELDAVLTSPLASIKVQLDRLMDSIAQPDSMSPGDRLRLLREVVDEMVRYKVGGDDKIRVANGACESLQTHIRQLDVTASLLVASLPPSLESRIPASTLPGGYPRLTGALRSKPSGGVWGDGRGFAGGSSSVTSPLMGTGMAIVGEPYPPPPVAPMSQVPMIVGPATMVMPHMSAEHRIRPTQGPSRAANYMGHGIGPGGFAYALGPDGMITDRKIHHNQHTKKRAREAEAAGGPPYTEPYPQQHYAPVMAPYPPMPGPGPVPKAVKRPRPSSIQDEGLLKPGDADAARVVKKRVKRTIEPDGSPMLQPGPSVGGNGAPVAARRRSPNSTTNSPALSHAPAPSNPAYGPNGAHLSSVQPHRTVSGRQVNPPVRPGEELDGVPSWAVSGQASRYESNGTTNGRHGSISSAGGGVRRPPTKPRRVGALDDGGGETETSNPGEPRVRPRRTRRPDAADDGADADAEGAGPDFGDLVDEIEAEAEANNSRIYCVCQGARSDDEQMVGCDNKDCPYEWFHLSCVGLDEVPEGSWYCEECDSRGYAPGGPKHRRSS